MYEYDLFLKLVCKMQTSFYVGGFVDRIEKYTRVTTSGKVKTLINKQLRIKSKSMKKCYKQRKNDKGKINPSLIL